MPIISAYEKELAIFSEKLSLSENIVILHHYNPDGDAIGASLGLYNALIQTEKKITVLSPTFFPDNLKWLPKANKIRIASKKCSQDSELFENADMIICVDLNATSRVGCLQDYLEKSTCFKALFDHHPYIETFSDVSIIDTNYCSACELVFELLENTYLKQYINKDVVTCLYSGILTDTGSFQYNSSNSNLYSNLAKMMDYQIEKNKIHDALFNSWSESRIRFMGHAMLNRMIVMPEYKTAYIYISSRDRLTFNEQFGDTENFVNLPMQISGIIFSAIFIERDNFVKASFRSKGTFDVNKFSAKYFNGGGHVNASGGESFDNLANTCRKFENLVKGEYAKELENYIY